MEQSYKVITAQRLGLQPAELLNYFEVHERAIATTPDGIQHIFTFEELLAWARAKSNAVKKIDPGSSDRSIPVAKKGKKGAGSVTRADHPATPEAIPVAKKGKP